jgi:hypothetical protein
MTIYSKTPSRRNLNPCASRDIEPIELLAVRAILRRFKVSPAVALAIAALAGLDVGAR